MPQKHAKDIRRYIRHGVVDLTCDELRELHSLADELHSLADAELSARAKMELQVEAVRNAARTRSRILTTKAVKANVWYDVIHDVFYVRYPWFDKDSDGYSTNLEEASRWFVRSELESIKETERRNVEISKSLA